MQISDENVKEFIWLYEKYYKIKLDEKEAKSIFENFIRIIKLISK
jgi:hypothetical protein